MNFELIEDYNKPDIKKINKYVSMAVYTNNKKKDTIVCIKNMKNDEVQTIYLLEGTLKKILKKCVDLGYEND